MPGRQTPLSISEQSLREAQRQLSFLEDTMIEDKGHAEAWVIAAHEVVSDRLRERQSDE